VRFAFRHRRGDFRDRAHLVGEVRGQKVDVAGEILPRAAGARHVRLTAQTAFDAGTSRATFVTCSANVASVSVMLLMVQRAPRLRPSLRPSAF